MSPDNGKRRLIINIFKKGDMEDHDNYRCITVLTVVGKVLVLNIRLVLCLDKGTLHEGQPSFNITRNCMNNYVHSK